MAIPNASYAQSGGVTAIIPAVLLWSGHPYLHGAITHKAAQDASYEFALLSLRGPRIREAQVFDGVFIAARREWIGRVGFDAERIRGFHFYDLDFTYRAYLAGARITLASDLPLVHRSHGAFDAAWSAAQSAFGKKHPQLDSTAGTNRHWYTFALANEEAVAELYAKLFAVWRLELPQMATDRTS